MKSIYLFGMNSIGETIAAYLRDNSAWKIAAYTAQDEYCTKGEYNGIPVVPFSQLPPPSDDIGIVNCVGYTQMMKVRSKIHELILKSGYDLLSYIHPDAYIEPNVSIGAGCIVLPRAYIALNGKIGNGNVIASMANITHDAVIGNFNWIAISSVICGYVTIGDHCFIGANSTIKEHIKIASNTLVGAGAYIRKDTSNNAVMVPPPTLNRK